MQTEMCPFKKFLSMMYHRDAKNMLLAKHTVVGYKPLCMINMERMINMEW